MSDFTSAGKVNPERRYRDGEHRPYQSVEYSLEMFSKDDERLIAEMRHALLEANGILTLAGVPDEENLSARVQWLVDSLDFYRGQDPTEFLEPASV